MKKGIWAIVVLIIIIGLVLINKNGDTDKGPIKVGVSLPLTGEISNFGNMIVAGVEYATKEINDGGGINGRQIELVFEDDTCSDAGATTFNKLANIDKVHAIVGPLCSSASAAGLPVAENAGVPVIFWGSAPGLAALGEYSFRTYPSDSLQGAAAADYMFNKMGIKKVAILYVQNDWGVGLNDIFSKEFKKLGGEIVITESVLPSDTDAKTQIAKIKAANSEAIYMPVFPQTGVAALRQAKNIGVNVPVVGGDAFNAGEIASAPEAEGVIIVQSKIGENAELNQKIKEATGKETGLYTAYGYDSIKILAKAFGDVGTDREKIKDYLKTLDYKEGVANPVISFDENGDLKEGEAAIFKITGGKIVPIQ